MVQIPCFEYAYTFLFPGICQNLFQLNCNNGEHSYKTFTTITLTAHQSYTGFLLRSQPCSFCILTFHILKTGTNVVCTSQKLYEKVACSPAYRYLWLEL